MQNSGSNFALILTDYAKVSHCQKINRKLRLVSNVSLPLSQAWGKSRSSIAMVAAYIMMQNFKKEYICMNTQCCHFTLHSLKVLSLPVMTRPLISLSINTFVEELAAGWWGWWCHEDEEHVGELDGWHPLVGQPSGHLQLHQQQEEPEYIALTRSSKTLSSTDSVNDIDMLLTNCSGCAIRLSQITLADTCFWQWSCHGQRCYQSNPLHITLCMWIWFSQSSTVRHWTEDIVNCICADWMLARLDHYTDVNRHCQ